MAFSLSGTVAVLVVLAGPVSAASAHGWSVVPTQTPVTSAQHFGVLNAVSCASDNACMAVGSGVNRRADEYALSEAWNGASWRIVSTAAVPHAYAAALSAVSCTAADACTAVGFFTDTSGVGGPLAERWNGSGWTLQQAPSQRGGALAGVSCSSATACMAVGATTNAAGQVVGFAEQWNGASWSVVPTPQPAGAVYSVLSAVSCSAPSACTAVGSTNNGAFGVTVERWDGTSWTLQSAPAPPDGLQGFLTGVSCPTATDCEAIGDYISNSFSTPTLAEQWNGSSWKVQATPTPSGAFILSMNGVSCATDTACSAVGWYQSGAVALWYNGTVWALQPTPTPKSPPFTYPQLNGVSCPTTNACTAVGSVPVAGTLVEQWNGSVWVLEASPNTPGIEISRLDAVSCPTPSQCIAVGSVVRASGAQATLADLWTGAAWRIVRTPTISGALTAVLSGVSCTAADACTAVGSYYNAADVEVPLVERWNGSTWTLQTAPAPASSNQTELSAVSCVAQTSCTAVGVTRSGLGEHQAPLIEHWDGMSWAVEAAPLPSGGLQGRLLGVSCTATTSCVAVGEYLNGNVLVGRGHAHQPMAEVWNGASWTAESIDRPSGAAASYLDAVSCTSSTSCIAVGWSVSGGRTGVSQPLAERWNGSGWTLLAVAPVKGSGLLGVSCPAADSCTAVGGSLPLASIASTLAEHWNGTGWTPQRTPPGNGELATVDCTSTVSCMAVGLQQGSAGYGVPLAERYSA